MPELNLELTPEQLAERTARLPLRPYPILYFALAHLSLVVAALAFALDPRAVAGFFYHPRMLAVVHLVTLGWITSSILGALYLVLPMAFRAPLERSRLDGWIFGLYFTGVLGMVSHFWIDETSGMVWAAGVVVLAAALAAARFLRPIARSPTPPEVRLHFQLAFANLLLAGLLGFVIGLDKFVSLLPGGPLPKVMAHAHLAILGWATMMVLAAGYRLLPMLLPAAIPGGGAVWASALLLEAGTLGLTVSLLYFRRGVPLAVLLCAAGLGAFASRVIWMLRHPRPAPAARASPDLGVFQAFQALLYLALATALGLALALGPPAVWKLKAAMAYGVAMLLGFLAQIVVGVASRLLPLVSYLWGFADRAYRATPRSPHVLPDRRLQLAVVALWTLAVPCLAIGLSFDRIGLVSAGGWLLTAATIGSGLSHVLVLLRGRADRE